MLLLAATYAAAAQFCVSCDGPEAHYACSIDGASATSTDPRLKLYCMTQLATTGGHASCTIDRAQQNPCAGVPKVLAAPEGVELFPSPPASSQDRAAPLDARKPDANQADPASQDASPNDAAKPSTPAAAAQETAISKTPAPPKTVKEMVEKGAASTGKSLDHSGEVASDAAKSAGSALEKAGNAVSSAAKKAWTCVASLFGDC